jgi:hypothetical protein
MVEVVYVCSPEYWRHLFLSLRTLFASGTHFDRVRVLVTAPTRPNWDIRSDKVVVEPVPDVGHHGFWMMNKAHLCRSEADVVLFLDTDTVVLRPIDPVYAGSGADLHARTAPVVQTSYFRPAQWEATLRHFGCAPGPYVSTGFLVLKNGAQKALRAAWVDLTERIRRGEGVEQVTRHANQYAFSIAAYRQGLSLQLMDEAHHAYAMIGEGHEGATVYHLGTPNFYYYYLQVERDLDLTPDDAPVKRPSFLRLHRLKNRLVRKVKMKMGMDRKSKGLQVANS